MGVLWLVQGTQEYAVECTAVQGYALEVYIAIQEYAVEDTGLKWVGHSRFIIYNLTTDTIQQVESFHSLIFLEKILSFQVHWKKSGSVSRSPGQVLHRQFTRRM